jgi:hypothetical protein
MRALKSEWIKLKSIRSTWISVAIVSVVILLNVIVLSESTSFNNKGEIWKLTHIVCGQTIIVVCGIIIMIFASNEFDNGTINQSLLATPNRTTYFLSKGLISSLYMTIFGIICMLLSFISIYAIKGHIRSNSFFEEISYHFTGNFIFSVLGFFLLAWLFHAIAMLARKSTTALSVFFGIWIGSFMLAVTLGRIKGFIGDFIKFLYCLTPNEIFRHLTSAWGMYEKMPSGDLYIIWWQALLSIVSVTIIINIVALLSLKKQDI